MDTVFLKILNISITASWLVLAVLLMRLVLKKAPKWLMVVMWALVGLRLVLPFTLESGLSLIPSTETVPPEILYETAPEIQTGIPIFNSVVNPVISETLAPNPGDSVNPLQVITFLAGWIWLIGMAGMAVYSLVSCLRIRHKLREAAPLQGNVYLCDQIDTPFIFGLFRPRIYLPSAMDGSDIPFVLAHEQAHLKRKDHLWKPLGFLLLTVYWFNPLLWLAYILLCRDIETACDEKVLQDMGEEVKKPYSQALVNCSVPRKMVAACPLAFGEVNVKSRIKKVLNYKKPAFWLLIAAVVVCIVLSVCFLTNPRSVNEQMQIFLDCQIASHFQNDKSAGNACCVDYEILGAKKNGKTTTVYMWVLYEEYGYQNGHLQQQTGAHIPTVITTRKEDGNYRLVEYFEPRDGAYNPGDIKAKFPWYLWPKAMDSRRYYKKQHAACLEMAEQYFKENPPGLDSTVITIHTPAGKEDALDEDYVIYYSLDGLKQRFPQYFDLPTDNGLEVYVWQMGANAHSWGLLPGNDTDYSQSELMDLKAASLQEICIIVASYNLDNSHISIRPIHMLHSSYYYVIDDVYQANVEQLFWGQYGRALESKPTQIPIGSAIDTAIFDIDNDGKDEICTISFGPTSGLFTFVVTAYENDQKEYQNIFLSSWGYLFFIEKEDGTIGICRDGRSQDQGREIYDIVVTDGNIQLVSWDEILEGWGPQGPVTVNRTCERAVIYYHGNYHNALTVEGPQICSYLLQQVRQAYTGRQQGESTKGHYGIPYSLELYLSDQTEPLEISLWDAQTFSTSDFCDSEGYPYFFKADISDLYSYLEENFPEELWYGDQAAVSYAGGDSEHLAGIWEEAINQKSLFLSSLYHLPVLKFDTLEEFQQFKARYPEAMDQHWNEVPSFNDVTAQFDDTYFEKNTLVLVYIPSGNGSSRYDILHLFQGRGELSIRICETIHPEIVSNSEANWFITVTLPDVSLETITEYDAILVDS